MKALILLTRFRKCAIKKMRPKSYDTNNQILIGLFAVIVYFALSHVILESKWIFQKPGVIVGFAILVFFFAISAQALKYLRLGRTLSAETRLAWERGETLLSMAALIFGLPLILRYL
jgi:thiol:disulfide interchange protein